jgi:crotonobetainyl-CoA:carnitine CoA-transferase CaiB-like acyl-CoA transferase
LTPAGSAAQIVHRVWADLGRDPVELDRIDPLPEVPLPARLDVSGLAAGAVAAAALAAATASGNGAGSSVGRVRLDGDRIATAFTSERWFRIDGEPPEVWAPLSGFRRAADGWVRTHANYPQHAAALRRGLGLAPEAGVDVVDAAIAARPAHEVETSVGEAGGVCVAVHDEAPDDDARRRREPLVELVAVGALGGRGGTGGRGSEGRAPAAPLDGRRVLDLTRVIAGPVGTRALAQLGAEVLRVDSPQLPEPEWQHLDSGAGKRSTLLDLRAGGDRARFDELLAQADAVVLGYRPAAMAALGLDPAELAMRHPHLVVAQLSAWGTDAVNADRRGFDSIVQAASGIARIEASGERPGALPAQALDHASGYLLAAAVISMLDDRAGGARIARVSLRRVAAELLGLPRSDQPAPPAALSDRVAERHLVELAVDGHRVRLTAPAIAFDDGPAAWPGPPRRWGRDQAGWAE